LWDQKQNRSEYAGAKLEPGRASQRPPTFPVFLGCGTAFDVDLALVGWVKGFVYVTAGSDRSVSGQDQASHRAGTLHGLSVILLLCNSSLSPPSGFDQSFFCKQPRPFYQAHLTLSSRPSHLEVFRICSVKPLTSTTSSPLGLGPSHTPSISRPLHCPRAAVTPSTHPIPIPIPAKHRPSLGLATGLLTNVAHRRCSDSGVSGQYCKRSKVELHPEGTSLTETQQRTNQRTALRLHCIPLVFLPPSREQNNSHLYHSAHHFAHNRLQRLPSSSPCHYLCLPTEQSQSDPQIHES